MSEKDGVTIEMLDPEWAKGAVAFMESMQKHIQEMMQSYLRLSHCVVARCAVIGHAQAVREDPDGD